MFIDYVYEKPVIVSVKLTDAITASFAGGGWLHLASKDKSIRTELLSNPREFLKTIGIDVQEVSSVISPFNNSMMGAYRP